MKVLIFEDERMSFDNLSRLLKHIEPAIEIDGPVTSVENAILLGSKLNEYNLIFSDIRLEDGLCFDIFNNIPVTTPIIFTTAYDEYALSAFQTNGIAYLLKPISADGLRSAIGKAKSLTNQNTNLAGLLASYGIKPTHKYRSRFLVNDYDGAHVLDVTDISHIEVSGDKVKAYLINGKSEVLPVDSLDAAEEMLDPDSFFRANRQYIVSVNSISRLVNSFRQRIRIKLKNYPDISIEVSKEKATDLRRWLDR